MKEKDYPGAESLLRRGLERADPDKDKVPVALYYSSLGVLAKLRGDFRQAWRDYEQAEKLMPDDPSLKVIVAKLLIDQFAQYESAIKKLKEVLKLAKGSAPFEHQARATLAIAYLKKGDKKKALQMFDEATAEDLLESLGSATHLNFDVLEAFLGRNFEVGRCRTYIDRALTVARQKKEEKPIQFLTRLQESFEVTLV